MTDRSEHPRKANTVTEFDDAEDQADEARALYAADFGHVAPHVVTETETYPADLDDLDDLIGETYIALGEAEDALGALTTRVELYHSHPSAPATIELERHLAAARAALAAFEDALPADGVHKPYPPAEVKP